MIFGGFRADVYYLNMSLFLGYATLHPNAGFLLFYIIPVKAWIFALFYLGLTAVNVIRLSSAMIQLPYNLYPLIAVANYFIFFGKDIVNVIPMSWRVKIGRLFGKKPKQGRTPPKTGAVPFSRAASHEASTARAKAN